MTRTPLSRTLSALAVTGALAVGSAHAVPLIGLTSTGNLVAFDSTSPTNIVSTVAISGLAMGESIIGIDLRPTTKQLFGVSNQSNLYIIDPMSGASTLIGAVYRDVLDGGATMVGIDFNPAADLAGGVNARSLRIVNNAGANLAVVGANPGSAIAITDLNFMGNPATGITSIAYNNNDLDPMTGTTLYYVNVDTDQLFINATPGNFNNGMLQLVADLSLDLAASGGFDIFGPNLGLLSGMRMGSMDTELFRLNLVTGELTSLGLIGDGSFSLAGLSAARIPEPGSMALALAGMGLMGFALRGRKKASAPADTARA